MRHENEAIRLLVLAICPCSEYARGYHVEGDLTPHILGDVSCHAAPSDTPVSGYLVKLFPGLL
jgi:hypothetical protein